MHDIHIDGTHRAQKGHTEKPACPHVTGVSEAFLQTIREGNFSCFITQLTLIG